MTESIPWLVQDYSLQHILKYFVHCSGWGLPQTGRDYATDSSYCEGIFPPFHLIMSHWKHQIGKTASGAESGSSPPQQYGLWRVHCICVLVNLLAGSLGTAFFQCPQWRGSRIPKLPYSENTIALSGKIELFTSRLQFMYPVERTFLAAGLRL